MQLTRENIYRLIAGTLGEDIKKFNPEANLIKMYKLDSLSILDIALVIEEHTDHYVEIPDAALSQLTTAKLYADYCLEVTNVPK